MLRQFRQVDVFTEVPYQGNPLAVVLGADGLTTEHMQRFANWTNLSETTFVLEPDNDLADYRVRIFTPSQELPFAGHPTLGTCHAWLEAGGSPRTRGTMIQECGAGLVTVSADDDGLRFAAPPLVRSGPVDEPLARHVAEILGIGREEIVDLQWADNGPGWIAVLLASADAVLAVTPGTTDLDLGIAGPYPPGGPPLSKCARSCRRTARPTRIRSPAASTLRWRSGCWVPAARRRRTWPGRGRRWAATARSGSARTLTVRCG